jgi:adenosylcobyric acid synthase
LPSLSNGTDFRLLKWAEWIDAVPNGRFDFVVLPGTKNTILDLLWLRRSGLADWILDQHKGGATVIGVCGGFQILGRSIRDPLGVESDVRFAPGLDLLPCQTVLGAVKTTVARSGKTVNGTPFCGYEIHMGATTHDQDLSPFAVFDSGETDGVRLNRVIGTYLHGVFEHPEVCCEVFGVEPTREPTKAEHYDRLADWFERHLRDRSPLALI